MSLNSQWALIKICYSVFKFANRTLANQHYFIIVYICGYDRIWSVSQILINTTNNELYWRAAVLKSIY